MGACSSRKKHDSLVINQVKGETNTKNSIFKEFKYNPATAKEYDFNNPHRQCNVWLNGVYFHVVNSIEPSLQDL